jgi:hypothetical protein
VPREAVTIATSSASPATDNLGDDEGLRRLAALLDESSSGARIGQESDRRLMCTWCGTVNDVNERAF